MKESEVEKYLRIEVEKLKGQSKKWVSPSNRGVPDRIVFLPEGKIYFIELKKPGENLGPLQKYVKKQLEALGQKVYKIDSKEGVDDFVRRVQTT